MAHSPEAGGSKIEVPASYVSPGGSWLPESHPSVVCSNDHFMHFMGWSASFLVSLLSRTLIQPDHSHGLA